MSFKLLDKLNRYVKKDYAVTVEIHVNDLPVHDLEVAVTDYNKTRAMKKAMKHVEIISTMKATTVKKL